MKPANRIMDKMNILASGNFKVRLDFGKPIKVHPAFEELADRFMRIAGMTRQPFM